MIIVGLTGGIGSGKTTVAKQFEALGVPVYIADLEAKNLMNKSKTIKRELVELFGKKAYIKGELNKQFIADIIFNDKSYLQKMNSIVHPRVAKHFEKWMLRQDTPYVIKEVAILFENNGYKTCDYIITVTAPKELRIERLLMRDDTTKAKIEAIMKNQWTDDEKTKLSHYVVDNVDLSTTLSKVVDIHEDILKRI
ncbi:dephospho-CoA kinase [Flavivirga eckloniae]|uniref:Dephospho-CoA kinase n=1 Tax=Flavivirga eckloniae TaxID=1803846 RepID=A0A2K9PL81_9FLAO|nr:dephospho-CoA kinase [Flavivirga eckloniae]AUP77824.1 dephospho-CoA kinase [Flavivirga eckloniae]